MKDNSIFKKYNLPMMKKNKLIIFFIIMSILCSVTISLALPQVVTGLREYWNEQAYLKNGADLKVEYTRLSEKFRKEIQELEKEYSVEEINEFNAVMKKEKQQYYCDLLVGNYDLNENEMILSLNIAKSLGVSEGEVLVFDDKEYKIKQIERVSCGVGKQGEEMGYAKVSKYSQDKNNAYANLFLINGEHIDKIKEKLSNIESSYTYTTVTDVKKEQEQQININAMSLNMINTLSIIMTVISLVSSIYLFIAKSERDIAIMKIESIKNQSIRKAFQLQFFSYTIVAVLLGAVSSIVLAYGILHSYGIEYIIPFENIVKLIVGMVFILLIFYGYIRSTCSKINNISPLSIFRSEESQRKNHAILYIILLTVLYFFGYGMYIDVTSAFTISMFIILLLGFFYVLYLAVLHIFTAIRPRKVINRYLLLNIRQKKFTIALTIMSLSFTIIFFLVGFTLSETIASSYSQSLKEKINYNYMISTKQESEVSKVLKQTDDTGYYTKINKEDANLYKGEELQEPITLVGVEKKSYGVTYSLQEGEDIIKTDKDGAMVSSAFANKHDYKLNDTIDIGDVSGLRKSYIIKGIYESGGMNDNHIIIRNKNINGVMTTSMYLVNTKHPEILKQMENASIVNLDMIGDNLQKSLKKALGTFKIICIICVFSAIIFNINIMYMKSTEEHRNLVIMRAMGINKNILVKNVLLESGLILFLTIIMSLGLYSSIINIAVKAMFQTDVIFSTNMMLVPFVFALVLIGGIFLIPVSNITKSNVFTDLRVYFATPKCNKMQRKNVTP